MSVMTRTAPVAVAARRDRLVMSRFAAPSELELEFADGLSARLAIELLGVQDGALRWETAAASPGGGAMDVTGVSGERILIDAGTLRYHVDASYAAEIDQALGATRLTRDELDEMHRISAPPAGWRDESEDLVRDSWK